MSWIGSVHLKIDQLQSLSQWGRFMLAIFIILASLSTTSLAQVTNNQKPPPPVLTGFVSPPGGKGQSLTRIRSDAPIPVSVSLKWTGKQVRTGTLRITLSSDSFDSPTLSFNTDEVTVPANGATQTYNFMLPPYHTVRSATSPIRNYYITVVFVDGIGSKTVVRNADFFRPGGTGSSVMRAMRVLAISANTDDPKKLRSLTNELRLERFNVSRNVDFHQIVTNSDQISVRDMYLSPEQYMTTDIVVLYQDALKSAGPRQLSMLGQWVKAGGALLVAPGSEVSPETQSFLMEMNDGLPVLNADGSFAPGSLLNPDGGLVSFRVGLGRVVVGKDLDKAEAFRERTTPAWLNALCDLWRVRADVRESIIGSNSNTWTLDNRDSFAQDQFGMSNFDSNRDTLGPYRLPTGAVLMNALLPTNVEIVPFKLVLLFLGIFVLVIGPFDYLFLGLLRMRRLTWLLFPVVALAFTIAAVFIGEHYLGNTDRGDSAIFIDVGDSGEVLRYSRYEMRFPGSSRVLRLQMNGVMVTAMNIDLFKGNTNVEVKESRDNFSGSYTAGYEFRMNLKRTTPHLLRYSAIGRMEGLEQDEAIQETASKISWSSVTPSDLRQLMNNRSLNSPANVEESRRFVELLGDLPDNATVYVFSGESQMDEDGDMCHVSGPELPFREEQVVFEEEETEEDWDTFNTVPTRQYSVASMFRSLHIRPYGGIFRAVSQMSPNGNANFEDLSILDPSDENQWMVVVTYPVGVFVVTLRHVYED